MITGATAALRLNEGTVGARRFFTGIALITVLPMIGVPLMLGFNESLGSFPTARLLLILLVITGSVHVGSTSYFYFDDEFRPLMDQHRVRCFWALLLLPVGFMVLGVATSAWIGAWALLALFTFQTSWLFYHYQRQNFGLISLASTHAGLGPLPAGVGVVLNLAALAGIVTMVGAPGLVPPGADTLVSADAHLVLRSIGTAIYAVSLGLLWRELATRPQLRRDPKVLGGIMLGWAFFLPSIVFANPAMGFLPYAVAHGAQYLFMMTILSRRSNRGWLGLATMCALAGGVGYGLDFMRESGVVALLAGAGLVQVHFLVDAKVWRLREPQQRAIMNRRFDFLLAK